MHDPIVLPGHVYQRHHRTDESLDVPSRKCDREQYLSTCCEAWWRPLPSQCPLWPSKTADERTLSWLHATRLHADPQQTNLYHSGGNTLDSEQKCLAHEETHRDDDVNCTP